MRPILVAAFALSCLVAPPLHAEEGDIDCSRPASEMTEDEFWDCLAEALTDLAEENEKLRGITIIRPGDEK